MNSKFFLAALAAAVVVFLGGWLVYGMLLMDYMAMHSFMKTQPAMWGIVLGNLSMGLFYAYICHIGNIKSLGKGLTTGILIAILIALSGDFIMLGAGMFDSAMTMLINVAGAAILGGLAGAAAGWVMGTGTTKAAA